MKTIPIILLALVISMNGCGPCCPNQKAMDEMKTKAYTAGLSASIAGFKNTMEMLFVTHGGNWTASEATDKTIEKLNADRGTMRGSGMAGPKLTYAKLYPTAPYQIVLIPIDSRGVIRIEGYGEDLKVPLVVEEYKVNY